MQIAVFISGAGSNLNALIQKASEETYNIGVVISNRPNVKGLEIAQDHNIATKTLDHTLFDSREAFEREILNVLNDFQIDVIILAGFMRILTPEFTERFLGRMLNIHPSLLPKYPGLNTHQRALDANDNEHGLSIHFVTSELDGGPVILQVKVPITPQDTVESLQKKVHTQEHLAYPLAVTCLANGDLQYKEHKAWFKNVPITTPLQLTDLKHTI